MVTFLMLYTLHMLHLTTKPLSLISVHYQHSCLSHSTLFKFQKQVFIILCYCLHSNSVVVYDFYFCKRHFKYYVSYRKCQSHSNKSWMPIMFIKVGFILKENNEHVNQKFNFIIIRVLHSKRPTFCRSALHGILESLIENGMLNLDGLEKLIFH